MGALAGIPVIGWAKPVPVNPNRLRNPRRDMLVGVARGAGDELPADARGRASSPAGCTTRRSTAPSSCIADLPLGVQIALSFAVVNLFLGLFNLLPIPPLDGAALLERVLPPRVAAGLVALPARTGSSCSSCSCSGAAARAICSIRSSAASTTSSSWPDEHAARISSRGSSGRSGPRPLDAADRRVGRRRARTRPSCGVWNGMSDADRAEGVAVARRLDDALAGAPEPTTRRHDLARGRAPARRGQAALGATARSGGPRSRWSRPSPGKERAREWARLGPAERRPHGALRGARRSRRRAPPRHGRPRRGRGLGRGASPAGALGGHRASRRPCAGRWPRPTGSRSRPD